MKKTLAAGLIAAVLVPAAAIPASAKDAGSTSKPSNNKCKVITVLDVNGDPYTVCAPKP